MTGKYNNLWIAVDDYSIRIMALSTEFQSLKANEAELSTSFFAQEYSPSFGQKETATADEVFSTGVTERLTVHINLFVFPYFLFYRLLTFTDFIYAIVVPVMRHLLIASSIKKDFNPPKENTT